MIQPKQSFPLHWPVGYKRTLFRADSRFKQTPGDAQKFLQQELNRIGAKTIIISSNAQLRNDGLMYADAMMRQADPGVAVYFNYKGKPVVLCCDTYSTVWENVYAIGKTIENLRAIERYGVSDFLNRSFTGFAELPESITTPYKPWFEVLGVPPNANAFQIKEAYRKRALSAHPDHGGSNAEFTAVKNAYEEGLKNIS